MEIFYLRADADNFRSLVFDRSAPIYELHQALTRCQRLAGEWRPQVVKTCTNAERGKTPLAHSDFPYLGGIPVFSSRAVSVLAPVLEKHGELLPLQCDDGEFWAYNVLHSSNALDEIASEIRWLAPGRAMAIKRFVFDDQQFEKFPIFRVRQMLTAGVFATTEFTDELRRTQLSGFVILPASNVGI